jgi:uncharacterized membrane protein
MKRKTTLSARLVGAAIAGLLSGTVLSLPACGDSSASAAERNGCNGPNGCGQNHKQADTNRCSGPNGCDGHGTKK